jgi:hypothetical protein
MSNTPVGTLSVRAYEQGDESAIQELFETTFGRRRTIEEWRWRFRGAPNGPALIHVLVDDGQVVGHLAHVEFDTFVNGRRMKLGHGGDTMVAESHRGRGGMRALVQGFLASDHGFDMRLNFPTDQAAGLMQRYGGGIQLGRIPQWVIPTNVEAALRNVPRGIGSLARFGLKGFLGVSALSAPRAIVRPITDFGPEFDSLADASARFSPCIRVRNAAYLSWRWTAPDGRWRMLEARTDSSDLLGFIVFDRDDRSASSTLRLGRIVDLLATDLDATRALLMAAVAQLRRQGCDAVLLDYQDPRPWARRACLRAGFLRRGSGPNVTGRALSERAPPIVEKLDNWYLTRGDTDLA